jgi:phosphatidyl-myo-inositol alpha-mannosyltransferase
LVGPQSGLYRERVRVGLVCPYSLTIPGGVQGQVLGLARSLRGLGHEVRVLGPCDGPPPDAGVTPLGASVPTASNGSVAPIAPDISCALRTIRALRDEEFDVVHVHEPMVPGPSLTSLITSDRPLVGTFHRSGASRLYATFRPLVDKVASRLDVRCAVSPDALDTARDAVSGEWITLFNGVEVDRFAKATPAPSEGPSILFLGRHEERKGLAVLLASLAHLPAEVRVWVASDGPQTEELKARFPDPRIEWLGRISDEERSARLAGASVACFPSLGGESFGVVLLEAMAARTPIVASDLPGYRNVATPDADAVLVPPGDAEALAAGLSRVLDDGSLAARLVAAGEDRAWQFSMDRLAERYTAIYESILAARPGDR